MHNGGKKILELLYQKVCLPAFLVVVCMAMSACTESALEQKVQEIAENPEMQTMQSYQELVELILSQPDEYAVFFDENGEIDAEKLQKRIENIGKGVDKDFAWNTMQYAQVLNRPLSLCLLLERSGSMDGYDARQCKGDFKRAINEVVNRFPDDAAGGRGNIMIVNSDIQPYSGSFQDFVQDRNIFSTTRQMGDPSYTDFGKIFRYALQDTVGGRISVLVTDMIYSPQGIEGVVSDKLRNEEAALMSLLGKTYKDKCMLIVRLSSDFIGVYYPFDTPRAGMLYKGDRPYYMIFMGNSADMDRMLTGSKFASVRDFASLPGFENYYYLGRSSIAPGYYTILPRAKEDMGLFAVTPGEGKDGASKGISDIEPDAKSGKYSFRMAVDLSAIPADDGYVVDLSNWTTSSPELLKVVSVEKITDGMRNVRNNRYLSKATHLIKLEGDRRLSGMAKVQLQNRVPAWVVNGSTSDDRNLYSTDFANTTYGLADMVQGLYSGFYGTAKAPDYTVYKIKID